MIGRQSDADGHGFQVSPCPNSSCDRRNGINSLPSLRDIKGQGYAVLCPVCLMVGPAAPTRQRAGKLWNQLRRRPIFRRAFPNEKGFWQALAPDGRFGVMIVDRSSSGWRANGKPEEDFEGWKWSGPIEQPLDINRG